MKSPSHCAKARLAMTGNPYFFRLVWQWWELPYPDSTFPRGCSLVVGAHPSHLTQFFFPAWGGGTGPWP